MTDDARQRDLEAAGDATGAARPAATLADTLLPLPDDMLDHNWSWFALRGVLMLALGVLALFFPGPALFAFALVFAAFSFADGLLTLVAGVRRARADQRRWWPLILSGLLGIAIGVAFFFFPLLGTIAYAMTFIAVVAGWAAANGALQIAAAWRLRKAIEGEWLLIASGVLSILLALALLFLLFTVPGLTLLSVAWVVGLWAVIGGMVMLALAWRLRRAGSERRSDESTATY